MGTPHPRGHRWEAFARAVISHYGGLCHICGHGGARQPDHVISIADRPDLAWKLENCRPAHGAPGNPCPVCTAECGRRVFCNQLRGAMSVGRAQRIIAEWREANRGARPPGRPEPDTAAGRPW